MGFMVGNLWQSILAVQAATGSFSSFPVIFKHVGLIHLFYEEPQRQAFRWAMHRSSLFLASLQPWARRLYTLSLWL